MLVADLKINTQISINLPPPPENKEEKLGHIFPL